MDVRCEWICKKTGNRCNRHFKTLNIWSRNNREHYCFQHEKINLIEEEKAYDKRKEKLIKALSKYGLKLRNDSRLCTNYMNGELTNWTLDEVVERMCQMKYLFDYCDIEDYIEKARSEYYDEINDGYFPDCSIIDKAEMYAMKNKKYPDKWPWLNK